MQDASETRRVAPFWPRCTRGLAGASPFETLAALVIHEEIDWKRVTAFHPGRHRGV
jgi:hypothetical protein